MSGLYCSGCGLPVEQCDGACRRPLDPPRFCERCGKRMAVQVMPGHYTARCLRHGTVTRGA
ncbi:MAG TPA: hypothetical protein VHE80_06370 [Acidimicrobiales bacterium]|nr:hypothetical protein [Acidimicrobiales bacterium]